MILLEILAKIMGYFLIAIMFLFGTALILTALFLAIACACELWDIYLKDIFRRIRERRNE